MATAATTRPAFMEKAEAAIGHGVSVAESLQRPDLAARLAATRARLSLPEVTVVVAGEFKQGKSTLVNALLNTDLCPVDDDVSTVVPTVVRHGEATEAVVVSMPETEDAPVAVDDEAQTSEPVRDTIAPGAIREYASEIGNPGNHRNISAVELFLPRPLLESGLVIVDTPGVGGLRSVHGAASEALLSTADVVIFVSDASQELTATEMEFLAHAHDACPNVVCVVTKTDLYVEWRKIVELDRGHIESAGVNLDVMPVASPLRQLATNRGDRDLNQESGYDVLVSWLRDVVLAQRQRLAVRAAGADLASVARQLATPLQAEVAIIDDPEHAAEVVAELTERKERAQHLLTQASRWQQLLNDGSQDLASEVDHDLRRRMRTLTTESTEKIEEGDPAKIWDEFSLWLEQEVAGAISANNTFMNEQAKDLARRVGELFDADGQGLVDPTFKESDTADLLPELHAEMDKDKMALLGSALTATRGAYGGVLMFGLVGQLAGLALLNPLTVVIGIGLGRRALNEERKRNRTVSQQKAKTAVSKYVDQASFLANKDSKDLVRRIQRELRDTYRERAKEVETSTRAALAAATAASKQTEAEARARIAELQAHLDNIGRLDKNASALLSIPVEGLI